ncbi:aldehyde dehydrogenase [Virgibacillus byunsanensis]|uniref:Aldehyde dehydrogenase n=1 Tax=Virgibacillus byunsanensis TaxID=570945 RepID=A0ABW3LHB0_9BACI
MSTEIQSYPKIFIGGEWVQPHSGRLIKSINPVTEEVWAEVAEADEIDIDIAVKAAREAFYGPWRRWTATERGASLRKMGDILLENAERLAFLETNDNGKPYRDTLGEIKRSAEWFYYYAGAADKIQGETIPNNPDSLAYTRREPVGVVGAITPWNSPISMYSWKIAPALAAGNTIVIKPAELTPVTSMEIARLSQDAGFPPGVINVVPGYGKVAGSSLAKHPLVNKIAFTGEYSTAQSIMKDAAVNLKRVSFECGGKAPHIIFDDADLDKALTVALHSAFRSTGQSCSLGSRLFVQRNIYKEFVKKLINRVRQIRVGMPLDKDTHIGPHTSKAQLDKTLQYIEIGKEEGAHLAVGGKQPEEFTRGYFVEPTVFTEVDNQSRLAQEEIFGPVLAIIPFDTDEDVLQMANNVQYGLVAGLWTKDIKRAHKFAADLEAGFISINTYRPIHWTLPYGGYKLSGYGRENGLEALHAYTEVKTVVVNLSDELPSDPFK